MKLWQYYGLLCGIWLAPIPSGSWTMNFVMALVMGCSVSIIALKRIEK